MSTRTFPLGGSGEFAVGIGQELWGSRKNAIYGFHRVSTYLEGVPDFLATGWRYELFPVSILGVRVGQNFMSSHIDYDDYDCTSSLYICSGNFEEQYIEVPLFFKLGPVAAHASYRQSDWVWRGRKNGPTEFIEPESGLHLGVNESALVTGEEALSSARLRVAFFFLFNTNPERGGWRLGWAYSRYERGDFASNLLSNPEKVHSEQWLGMISYNYVLSPERTLNFMLGAGEYHSDLFSTEPTYAAAVSWQILPKLGY